jgi:threonine synthase
MAGWAGWLPYLSWPSLGEGGTPALSLPRFAAPLDLSGLWLKAEWMNPTGSHKDRMTPLALARALEVGARGVACASTGNAALSLAAYAAAAGIPARIVTTAAMPSALRTTLIETGAVLDDAPDALARWAALGTLARDGWYSVTNHALPPVGSSAWGVEGYKSVAFELAADPGGPIDAVLVPVARGDLLWGIGAGFAALARAGLWQHPIPRLYAVEPFPRLTRVLAGVAKTTELFTGRTCQGSIAGATLTDQALRAVRDSEGGAVVVDDAAALPARRALARHGLALELCAAATLAAADVLRSDGALRAGARVVAIGTAAAWHRPDA